MSGTERKRLVAVVATHDRLGQLRQTLERLLAAAPRDLAGIVVVDNASTDGTAAYLAGLEDPRLIVHRSEANLGGAGGMETGMRLAVARLDPDWIVLMDDDGRPEPGALAAFHDLPRDPDAAYAAAVYYPDGRICEMNRPSVNPFWRPRVFAGTLLRMVGGGTRDGYHIPRAAYDAPAPRPIDMTSFVGLFLPRRAVEAAGYPEGRLFLYGDDVIYTLGLRRAGIAIAFDPRIRFEHDCSTFADDRRRVFNPLWKVYYTYRNGLMMYRSAAGPLFWPMLLMLVPKWWLAARRYGPDRPLYLRLMRRALADALTGRPLPAHAEVRAMAGPAPAPAQLAPGQGRDRPVNSR